MAAVSTIIAGVGLAANVAGGMKQRKAQKRQTAALNAQAAEQRKAIAAQRRQDEIRAARSRVQSVREARIKRASIVASAGAQGSLGSSSAIGGLGSLQSQLGENIGFQGQIGQLGGQANAAMDQASIFGTQANNAAADAATGQAIAGVGSSIFSAAGGSKTLFKAFGGGGSQSNFNGGMQGPV